MREKQRSFGGSGEEEVSANFLSSFWCLTGTAYASSPHAFPIPQLLAQRGFFIPKNLFCIEVICEFSVEKKIVFG